MASAINNEASSPDEVVESLASKYKIDIEAARAIFTTGVEAGRLSANVALSSGGSREACSFTDGVSFESIRKEQAAFAKEREWDQFHTPRNLALALVGEVGELCECFQWKGEVAEGLVGFKPAEIEHVGQELSDVLLYLLRLSEKCHIDLPVAAKKKMALNAKKYPSEKVKGSSKKYNEY
mmetsp:Transcript_13335/g.22588  ORF Transcript_13335/g.22588 Transcript_13335/m.22588 type:complete len:180 (-) Transcript_13335:363-902(-)